jgi:Protein of unknown function (DUF1553)/Protein of unknown function (DUF1549)/Planctomycete cytochrome C
MMIRTLLIGLALAGTSRGSDEVDYNRDVRPILAGHCFTCHGLDESSRKAGLRLDLKAEALKPLKSGVTAIVPGSLDDSELIERIFADEPDRVMPPTKHGKPLSTSQKETLRRWVSQGAPYRGHWAFEPPVRPQIPSVKNAKWPRNPIDAFVLARLEAEGLHPSPEASKNTLIRRVSLDLTGLPPTPREVDAFVSDPSPNAYEKVVDRLLASERYGERMAMPWLDFARYADSNGYQSDSSRDMSPWRDWVIRAFNRNLPFDQFTVEQLAGDLLPEATRDQLVATGFNRNHRLTSEGGSIQEEWRVETVIDRVETTSLTWLGLTLGCARCHDHKYDPVSQKEFYQFFAFFNNVPESGMVGNETKNTDPTIPVPTTAQEIELARLEGVVAEAARKVTDREKDLARLIEAWEPEFRKQSQGKTAAWMLLEPSAVVSSGGATFKRLDDASWLAGGTNPSNDVYTITSAIKPGAFSGLLLETFPDPSLPNESLGRYPNGNYVLTGVEAEISAPGLEAPLKARFNSAEADYSQRNYEAKLLVDDNPSNGWAIDGNDPAKRLPRKLVLAAESPLTVPEGATITVRLKHEAIDRHNIGRFRVSTTSRPREMVKLDASKDSPSVLAILEVDRDKRSPKQVAELSNYFRKEVDSPIRQADQALASAKKAVQSYRDSFSNSMVMRELPSPREAFLLIRGQYDRRGEPVKAGLPAALPPLPLGQPMNRLGLARWIVDPSNPLTSRVWVNRTWEKFFGTGLAKTTENLGTQAEFPSHPELLDWLATEFVRLGWDMKAMQKQVVMSATYRQSSKVTPSLVERDPENRLMARGPRFRLSGEVVRDQALAVSGLLVEKVGGPSVRPYMPEGVWNETTKYGNLQNYQADKGEGLYRRTMYTIWKRTAAPPTLLLFDAPNRETCTIKRSRTNTPLQALALLNEVTYVEAARKLAERMMLEGGSSVEERINYGFRLATARAITPGERKVLMEGLTADLERYRREPDSAKKLIASGQTKANPGIPAEELAAYTLTANVLLNLDEVVTRE